MNNITSNFMIFKITNVVFFIYFKVVCCEVEFVFYLTTSSSSSQMGNANCVSLYVTLLKTQTHAQSPMPPGDIRSHKKINRLLYFFILNIFLNIKNK